MDLELEPESRLWQVCNARPPLDARPPLLRSHPTYPRIYIGDNKFCSRGENLAGFRTAQVSCFAAVLRFHLSVLIEKPIFGDGAVAFSARQGCGGLDTTATLATTPEDQTKTTLSNIEMACGDSQGLYCS